MGTIFVDETKKFLWMDGVIRLGPDPDWNTEKAVELGIIPKPLPIPTTPSKSRENPVFHTLVSEVLLNSLGSLRWEDGDTTATARS